MNDAKRITQSLIDAVINDLRAGKNINMELPSGGSLNLDRKLPFLCLCRSGSEGLEQFVKSEAVHLMAPAHRFYQKGFTELVRAIVGECARDSQGFLILELWEAKADPAINKQSGITQPAFKIVSRQKHVPSDTIGVLRNALSRIRVQRIAATVKLESKASPKPSGAPILIPHVDQKRLNCYWIGVEVSPIYKNPQTGDLYPALHRLLHRGITKGIKQAVYTFCHAQTGLRPKSHLAFGPRGVPRRVWNIDKRIAEISNQIDFLFLVSPINSKQAWSEFQKSKFKTKPRFFYRPIPFDTALVKRELYRIPIDELNDPVWINLFQQKRRELDIELSMLRDRNTGSFFYGSMQLHGGVSDDLLKTAYHLLENLPVSSASARRTKALPSKVLKEGALALIKSYQAIEPDFKPEVVIRDDITGLLVSKNTFYIGELRSVADDRITPLLEHEIGTHVLTYYNATCQPLALLRSGLPGYDELQEGIAVLAEYLCGGLSITRLRLLAARVVAVRRLIDGATFEAVFSELVDTCKLDKRAAFICAMRVFRSGGLTKDAVYLKGLVQIIAHLQAGNPFRELLIGKFNFQHLSIIRELTARNVLTPPRLLPVYLRSDESQERLANIKHGLTLEHIIERELS